MGITKTLIYCYMFGVELLFADPLVAGHSVEP